MDDNERNHIKTFDCHGDQNTLGLRWKRWLIAFELFADGKGLIINEENRNNRQRRRALLLHLAGTDVQDIFYTLPNIGDAKDYKKAVDALNAYFVPKVDTTYARHCFRQLTQAPGETIRQFTTRLRRAAKDCDYGADTDNQIRDEILCKCTSTYVKRKLLEEGQGLTLAKALEIAENCEKVNTQLAAMSLEGQRLEEKEEDSASVNRIEEKKRGPLQVTCYRCGRVGHISRDKKCPARGHKCHKCGLEGHFQECCQTKHKRETRPKNTKRHRDPKAGSANMVDTQDDEDDPEYAFAVGDRKQEKIEVTVGGCKLNVIVDSGASTNIIDKQTWEWLKRNKVKCKSTRSDKKLYAYASQTPLDVIGTFSCEISTGKNTINAEFCVIDGKGDPLLGRETATNLGVLKIGIDIAAVNTGQQDIGEALQEKYPEVFSGVGKLKGRAVQLHIDPNVKPVAQPIRRTPFSLRSKVEEKIQELISLDIIEPADGPTPWVNPVVVVPKSGGDIRLCIDMRRANKAILRERHPIPTVDEIMQSLNGSKVFSKLDLKWGYHQLELTPESRGITTFVTHCGLFRYKRLLFGVNSASEQYQHEIQTALAGIEGQENISDDIIVHGKDQAEHDARLEMVIKRLGERGLTLNAAKCQFSMDTLTFVGMVLSGNGISCAAEKVEAVTSAREPQNATETRSFLGLVNYCGRFIPDLATISEPLRRLTKAGTPFVFGKEQKEAFDQLKKRLSSAETLGYFDKDAPTQVIADASPVGLGAVLTQMHKDGPRIISYASRSLTDTETRYSQTEKEALALIWACEKFHPYIYGVPFELVTDHKPLEVIYGPKSKPCARIERWVLRMQPYKFEVKYQPGPKNIADPLSRLVKKMETEAKQSSQAEEYVRFVAVSATPNAMTTREVEEASAEDEELLAVRQCINGKPWDQLVYKRYLLCSGELCSIGKLVLRGTRIAIPKKLRPRVLSLAHEGHLGIVGTKQKLRSKVWWPGMEKDAEKHCKTCYGCQLVSRPSPPEPIRTTPLPTGPWRDLAVDLLGPLPTGESILVVVDYYSRYYEVDILRSTVAPKIISSLEGMFARHGLPESLTSDNGPQFISTEFAEYVTQQGIRHHKVTAKWPQANGEVERQNSSLLKRIQIAHAEKKDWKKELNVYLAAYRALPHPTTGVSPAELLFGRKIRTKLPELSDVHVEQGVRDRDNEQKSKSKIYADSRRGARYSEVLPGDQVLVQQEKKNKLSTRFSPIPYTVVSKHGNSLIVQSQEGVQYSRNTTHVKKLLQNGETPSVQEETVTETSHKEQEPAQQQNVAQGPIAVETEVPPRNHAAAVPEVPLRRSQRQTTAPSYLKDYCT